jgi:hypothetical protein
MERMPRAEGEAYAPPEVREFSPQARHEVPLGVAIETQQKLMNLMVPDRLKPYLGTSTGDTPGIEDAIFYAWHEKYAKRFARMCEKLAEEEEGNEDGEEEGSRDTKEKVFSRLVEGRSTSEDYETMKKYLESEGNTFFTQPELDVFIKEQVH